MCALVAALAISAPASAECVSSSVTQDQYGDDTDSVTTCNAAGAGAAAEATGDTGSAGSLPFTGLDLALMGGAAGALLVGGVLIRRRARAEEA